MALNFTFPGTDGKPVEGELRRGKYADNGTLAVVVYSKSELGDFMEPYQVLTVNLMSDVQDDKTAFIDENNCSFDLDAYPMENGTRDYELPAGLTASEAAREIAFNAKMIA